jgi:hypothetical protein
MRDLERVEDGEVFAVLLDVALRLCDRLIKALQI